MRIRTHRHTGQGTFTDEQPAEMTPRKANPSHAQHARENARASTGLWHTVPFCASSERAEDDIHGIRDKRHRACPGLLLLC